MSYVITRLCVDCVNTACASVCPVDCIYEYKGDDHEKFPNQLYIDPDACIDCGACEPECPWEAIVDEADIPAGFEDDVKLNYAMMENREDFEICEFDDHDRPPPADVAKNKEKWNWPS